MISNKLCECGCGGFVSFAKQNEKKWNYIKGKPKRFIKGHQWRGICNWTFNNGWCLKKGRWFIHNKDGSEIRWANIIYSYYYLNGNPIPKDFLVHHKNNIIDDDHPTNLEMLTRSQHNTIHKVKPIILIKYNERLYFPSLKEAARFLNVSCGALATAKYRKRKIKDYEIVESNIAATLVTIPA
jgi:hypothetical protein